MLIINISMASVTTATLSAASSSNRQVSVRTVRNKCVGTRVELGSRIVRVFSIFCTHPSQVPEQKWTLLRVNGDDILVDYITRELLSECECAFLFDKHDTSDEPSVMAVEMRPLQSHERKVKPVEDAADDEGIDDDEKEDDEKDVDEEGASALDEVGEIVNEIADGIANLST